MWVTPKSLNLTLLEAALLLARSVRSQHESVDAFKVLDISKINGDLAAPATNVHLDGGVEIGRKQFFEFKNPGRPEGLGVSCPGIR